MTHDETHVITTGNMEVRVEDVQQIVDWWRSANEAPGGCSDREAINGMKNAVWHLEQARRARQKGYVLQDDEYTDLG